MIYKVVSLIILGIAWIIIMSLSLLFCGTRKAKAVHYYMDKAADAIFDGGETE